MTTIIRTTVRFTPVVLVGSNRLTVALGFVGGEGLQESDQIVAVNDVFCASPLDLHIELTKHTAKPHINLSIVKAETGTEVVVIKIKRKPGELLGMGCGSSRDGESVMISSVCGAAESAGLKLYDKLIAVNGRDIKRTADLAKAVEGTGADATIWLVVRRKQRVDNEKSESTSRSHSSESVSTESSTSKERVSLAPPKLATVSLQYDEGDQVGIKLDDDLRVESIMAGSLGVDAFLVGDVIKSINNIQMKSRNDVYGRLQKGGTLKVAVSRVGKEPSATRTNKAATECTTDSNQNKGSCKFDRQAINLKLQLPANEELGIFPDENCKILRIQDKTIGAMHFHVGDVIKSVNGDAVHSAQAFERALAKHRPSLTIAIERSPRREARVQSRQYPANIEPLIKRHAGYEYMLIDCRLDKADTREFGLSLANCSHNCVFVTTSKPASVAADHFKRYDRILMINNTPVSDQLVTRELICDSEGSFKAIIERPRSAAALASVKSIYENWRKTGGKKVVSESKSGDSAKSPTSVPDLFPPDVMDIGKTEVQRRLAAKDSTAPKSILRTTKSPNGNQGRNLRIKDQPVVTQIVSDVPPSKRLRKCS